MQWGKKGPFPSLASISSPASASLLELYVFLKKKTAKETEGPQIWSAFSASSPQDAASAVTDPAVPKLHLSSRRGQRQLEPLQAPVPGLLRGFHLCKFGHLTFPELCQEGQCQGFPGAWGAPGLILPPQDRACLSQLKGRSTGHANLPTM